MLTLKATEALQRMSQAALPPLGAFVAFCESRNTSAQSAETPHVLCRRDAASQHGLRGMRGAECSGLLDVWPVETVLLCKRGTSSLTGHWSFQGTLQPDPTIGPNAPGALPVRRRTWQAPTTSLV